VLIVGYLLYKAESSSLDLTQIAVVRDCAIRVSDKQLDKIVAGDELVRGELSTAIHFLCAANTPSDVGQDAYLPWSICDPSIISRFANANIRTVPEARPETTTDGRTRHARAVALITIRRVQDAATMAQDFTLAYLRISDVTDSRTVHSTECWGDYPPAHLLPDGSRILSKTSGAAKRRARLAKEAKSRTPTDGEEAPEAAAAAAATAAPDTTSGVARRRTKKAKAAKKGKIPIAAVSLAVTGTPLAAVVVPSPDGTPKGEHNGNSTRTVRTPDNPPTRGDDAH
jgi:hypothetical protein